MEAKKKDSLERVLLELQSTKKLSTLDKSKVDWEKDKEIEGDAEKLAQFSKSEKSVKIIFIYSFFVNIVTAKKFDIMMIFRCFFFPNFQATLLSSNFLLIRIIVCLKRRRRLEREKEPSGIASKALGQ